MLKLLKYNKLSFKYYLDVYIVYLKVPDITYLPYQERQRDRPDDARQPLF
jgi:hypothetical protein